MEIDLAQLDSSAAGGDLLRAEVCVVGGGIAGLTLAQELAAFGHEVLLLEAGGSTSDDDSQSYKTIQAGHPHPGTMEQRTHALGGTSLVWGGQLLPLPGGARWPVTAAELAPYASQAEQVLGVDNLPYDAQSFFKDSGERPPALMAALPQLEFSLSKFAPFSHRNLTRTIGHKLRKYSNARIILHAQATELRLSPSRDRVEAVLVRAPSARAYRVEAKQIVLAAGTIETVRLLLASRPVAHEGIGNEHDQVGRNFHDHLTVTAANLSEPARRLLLSLRPWVHRGTLHAFKLSADPELRRRLNLNPVLAHLTIDEPDDSGIGAIRNVLRARQQGGTAESLHAALPQLPSALRDAALLVIAAGARHRRYVSRQAIVQLRLNIAQQTPSASRITLSKDLNPVLDWRIDASEPATLRRFTKHLRSNLQTPGIDWAPSLLEPDLEGPIPVLDDARHAMGGACMGLDPEHSVVNAELRVHGLRNLFIASAAVFPDGSPQLPTLPLMALTLRLARHLHRQI